MHEPEIPLERVRAGMFLLLGDDPSLEDRLACHLFCEPSEVLAVHRRPTDDGRFLVEGGMIVDAAGWHEGTCRRIVLEMARRDGGRVRVRFPDDRHVVSNVRVWTPAVGEAMKAEALRAAAASGHLVTDPATGRVHDDRDLSIYGLPAFWRDASVVWSALPATWIGKVGWLRELLVLEAISGTRSPAPADIRASETPFHEDMTICVATRTWKEATVLGYGDDGTIERRLEPAAGSILRRLIRAFGSAAALRSAALAFVEAQLDDSGADQRYLVRFRAEREAVVKEVAADQDQDRRSTD